LQSGTTAMALPPSQTTRWTGIPPRRHRGRGSGTVVRKTIVVPIAALALSLLSLLFFTGCLTQVNVFGRDHHGSEDVLSETALHAFASELPHWWTRLVDKKVGLLWKVMPDVGASLRLSALRRELPRREHSYVKVDPDDPQRPHSQLLVHLMEACHVMGLSNQEVEDNGWLTRQNRQWRVWQCPQLWVDEAWPPGSLAPSGSETAVAWSAFARPGESDAARGIMVLQLRRAQELPLPELKATIGFELGKALWASVALTLPGELLQRSRQAFVAARMYQCFNGNGPQYTFERSRPQALPSSPGTSMGSEWDTDSGAGRGLMGLPGLAGPATEVVAMDLVLKRMIPLIFRPFIYGALLSRGQDIRNTLQPFSQIGRGMFRRPPPPSPWMIFLSAVAPWLQVIGETGSLYVAGAVSAAHGRSVVITADRVSALVSGDPKAAAMALLRTHGLLPGSVQNDMLAADQVLEEIIAKCDEQRWSSRRQAFKQALKEPAVEVRVCELLRWSQTTDAERLLAFAELRRGLHQGQPSILAGQFHKLWSSLDFGGNKHRWPHYALALSIAMVALLMLPLLCPIDIVRWAAIYTLTASLFGISGPLVGGAGLPLPLSIVVAVLFVAFSTFAKNIWWNHLLGGVHRWAKMSTQLSERLTEQADWAAGITYLTREWAEMAHRSMAALDGELLGSWNHSLQELASKLTDHKQECQVPARKLERTRSLPLHRALPGSKALALHRHSTNPNGGEETPALWLKVDRAVQRVLHVEVMRMQRTLRSDNSRELKAMMTWWLADGTELAEEPMPQRRGNNSRTNMGSLSFPEDGEDTLPALLHSGRIFDRFPYTSFIQKGRDSPTEPTDTQANASELARLEREFASNLAALQELQSQLRPWTESPENSRACFRWPDPRLICKELRRLLPFEAKISAVSAAEQACLEAERHDARCLAAALCAGTIGAVASVMLAAWVWAITSFGFVLANLILTANYSRLSLPHVHHRFDQRLHEISGRREAIVEQIRAAQEASERTSLMQMKAAIFLQSVNMLRNITYVMSCIKTEVQAHSHDRDQVAVKGLQLLFAILPRCHEGWKAEILNDQDCGQATLCLQNDRFHLRATSNSMQQWVIQSQRRLWILFRMVHLYSVLPTRAQGRLDFLVKSYLQPILVDGHVPISSRPLLELGDSDERMPKRRDLRRLT